MCLLLYRIKNFSIIVSKFSLLANTKLKQLWRQKNNIIDHYSYFFQTFNVRATKNYNNYQHVTKFILFNHAHAQSNSV